jgi:uncharacterized protein YdhG (YjbR/CyaY superfamily)
MERNREVDKYIKSTPKHFRQAMVALREKIFEYFPEGEEVFAYNIPVYKYKGKALFSIAAFQDHYSVITQDKDISAKVPELANFKISGTTVHFNEKQPISDDVLAKIIQVRMKSRKE